MSPESIGIPCCDADETLVIIKEIGILVDDEHDAVTFFIDPNAFIAMGLDLNSDQKWEQTG